MKRPKEKNQTYHNPKELFNDRWTPECQCAFDAVIEKHTTAPCWGSLALHRLISCTQMRALLAWEQRYQEQEGQMRPIAFASRGLSHSEARYPAHKLEFLALKWSVTEKFSDYLYGNQFSHY